MFQVSTKLLGSVSTIADSSTTRLLFLLHGHVLELLGDDESRIDPHRQRRAHCGLGLACKAKVDVMRFHGEGMASMLPLCAFYNLRLTRTYLQKQDKLVVDLGLSHDADHVLRAAEEKYRQMWSF